MGSLQITLKNSSNRNTDTLGLGYILVFIFYHILDPFEAVLFLVSFLGTSSFSKSGSEDDDDDDDMIVVGRLSLVLFSCIHSDVSTAFTLRFVPQ